MFRYYFNIINKTRILCANNLFIMETTSYNDPMKVVNQSHMTNQSFTSMLNDAFPNYDVTHKQECYVINKQKAFVTSQQPQNVQNQVNVTNQTLSTPTRQQVRFKLIFCVLVVLSSSIKLIIFMQTIHKKVI